MLGVTSTAADQETALSSTTPTPPSRSPSTELTTQSDSFSQEGVLKALGFDPRDPKVQALALVAQRYNLDLILKHVFLIQGTVYVSHAGLLHLAHVSGDLDGIEVELHEDDKKYVATARIYRKSMSRPFVYTDQCLKTEKVQSPRKRAITRAERNALRRAFDVGVDVWEDDRPTAAVTLSDSRPEIPRQALPTGIAGEGGPQAGRSGSASRDPDRGAAPEPPSSAPTEPWRSVVIRCREMGLSDELRHSLVRSATNGRTESSKDLTPSEASVCHQMLHDLVKTGEPTWHTSTPTTSNSSNPPSTESPAKTNT